VAVPFIFATEGMIAIVNVSKSLMSTFVTADITWSGCGNRRDLGAVRSSLDRRDQSSPSPG
jgi:hypothetical protein